MNKGANVRALGGFPCILVAPLCGVAKEWRVPHLGRALPMPDLRVPGKPINETGFKNLEKGGLVSDGNYLATLNEVPCLSWERTLIG